MLKKYDELIKIDVTPYCEQRDGFDYLNWARCIELLHKNGAEKVFFTPLLNPYGSSLFSTEKEFVDKNNVVNQCYEVGVHIVIDDIEFDMRGPLMNGTNPVKDNSMSQQRIWNCQTRLFVKGVAIMTGLGFNLWLKNEEEEQTIDSKMDDMYSHSIMVIKDRIQQLVTLKMDGGLSLDEIATKTGVGPDAEAVKDIFRYCNRIINFEEALKKI